ncbi:MAG: DUF159 family protein [Actinobacteria bacterium]|uniref:Unannotated protein n=1 Tax=freshwater metagenome TaxID=449393 RepID=A0A6J6TQD2_9ZZZZ|nr:SOS response-associated peptidase [Actinomycetota bacterium]MSW47815.1 DUF159 family protein [Actinomycetota bacterium]MSX24987.1 DUF159 family protein [Actinomycetota bacterium]MSY57355.1 DUF159 family protein [Actinomycetota bacterium]MTB00916.1 DUF159 family protein [Actinomycetota bacterium]
MCGRYAQSASMAELVEEFGITGSTPETPLPASWNIAPTQEIYILRQSPLNQQLDLATVSWGLIGHWHKDWANARASQSHAINARSESIFEKPTFRDSFRKHRCLIPADGYYEWATELGRYAPKQPFYISRKDGHSLSIAGIWSSWVAPNGELVETASIITREAVGILAPIHHRMPVIMPSDRWESWLNPENREVEELKALMEFSEPERGLQVHAVSSAVNTVANNGPTMTDEVTLGEPETLF